MNNDLAIINDDLNKLSSFFVWNRKAYAQSVSDYIANLQGISSEQQKELQAKNLTIRQQEISIQSEQQRNTELTDYAKKAQAKIEQLQLVETEHHKLQDTYQALTQEQNKLNETLNSKVQFINEQNQSLNKEKEQNKLLTEERDNLKITENDYNNLCKQHQSLANQHDDLSSKNKLITSLLSAKPPANDGLMLYKRLLEDDYIEFASNTMSLEEAKSYRKLTAIQHELELVIGFPEIYTKTIVGISGGFSSGKSAFVNSFMKNNDVALAVGINPVTAIPSYVISSQEIEVKGYAKNGGEIALSTETYAQMTHDYIKSFDFNVKDIMPFMSIGVAMKDDVFDKLCFIDTPGYNPADKEGYTDKDRKTAMDFIEQSDVLLWIIGSDSTGTIPESDVQFIKEFRELEEKGYAEPTPIYFVLNKADLKSPNEIKDILREIEDTLYDEDIEFAGISAYSSFQAEELQFIGQSLFDFFASCSNTNLVSTKIYQQIDEVIDTHTTSLLKQINDNKLITQQLKSIRLDVMESGNNELYEDITDKFLKITNNININQLTEHLEKAERLRRDFKSAVATVFNEDSAIKFEKEMEEHLKIMTSEVLETTPSESVESTISASMETASSENSETTSSASLETSTLKRLLYRQLIHIMGMRVNDLKANL